MLFSWRLILILAFPPAALGAASAEREKLDVARTVIKKADELIRPGVYEGSLRVGGLDRWFIVHTPPGYSHKGTQRLIIALHAAHGSMATMDDGRNDLRTLARERNFVLVFPNGQNSREHRTGRSFWNADFCCNEAMTSGIDDVEFITRMTDFLIKAMSIDSRRIHVLGLSNGGMLAQKIAAEAPGRYASFVSMAAVPGYYKNGKKWVYTMTKPAPVMLMHGTADRVVDFHGGVLDNIPARKTLSFHESLRTWAVLNGCSSDPPTEKRESVSGHKGLARELREISYRNCGAATVGVAVEGVGHVWFDVESSGFRGTQRAVEFFHAHPR
ncbi:MAG: hypothetical protein FJ145_10790 [Deltaproteobacteria bacterium]|nr:hypothetical protein [Deltaproteobacteria bacterium]